jgi:hypothetical protein
METKIAVVETEIKNLDKRFCDFLDDVRSLRSVLNTVTIALVTLIFSLAVFVMGGFNDVSNGQMRLVKEQVEISNEIKEIKNRLVNHNESMDMVIRDNKDLKLN